MLRTKIKFAALLAALLAAMSAMATPAMAQDAEEIETLQPQAKRVRIVEAIPMWVDAEKLRIRDNPYAGDVVGMLEMGQKVKIHAQADNWIRISSDDKPSKWVNRDFLSENRVTWSNYEFGSRSRNPLNAPYDVELKRIKIDGIKDMKIYAAHVKAAENDGRIVITRHDFRTGPYYEKRLVHCNSDGEANHVRMLGEGYNYNMVESDPRNAFASQPADEKFEIDSETSALNSGIAEFTCKAKDI